MERSFAAALPISRRSGYYRSAVLLAAGLLGWAYHSISGSAADGSERIAMRYLLFAWSGLIAFLLPYLSFPDPRRLLCQLGNLRPRQLASEYLRRHEVLLWGGGFLILVTTIPALSEGGLVSVIVLIIQGGALAAGVYLYGAGLYLKIGADSQRWQEGERGMEWSRRVSAAAKYPVDPGSIPSLLVTVKVTLFGMGAVVTGALLSIPGGTALEPAVAMAALLFGLAVFVKAAAGGDRWYYQTNAFFGEFFGLAGSASEVEERSLRPNQLWWVPGRWRTHAWALMIQMDRRLPAGRVVAAGHLLIWIFAYRGAEGDLLVAFWVLFAFLHQLFLLLTASAELVPGWWLRLLDRPAHWAAARFWVQVRWLLPMAAGMAVMMWIFGRFGWEEIIGTLLFYLLAAVLAAFLAAMTHERMRKRDDE